MNELKIEGIIIKDSIKVSCSRAGNKFVDFTLCWEENTTYGTKSKNYIRINKYYVEGEFRANDTVQVSGKLYVSWIGSGKYDTYIYAHRVDVIKSNAVKCASLFDQLQNNLEATATKEEAAASIPVSSASVFPNVISDLKEMMLKTYGKQEKGSWYSRNRERALLNQKKYNAANHEKYIKYQRAYRAVKAEREKIK